MTPDEQEALSHQALGRWCVPLSSGKVAVFSHPNGKLELIVYANALMYTLSKALLNDIEERKRRAELVRADAETFGQLNLDGISL